MKDSCAHNMKKQATNPPENTKINFSKNILTALEVSNNLYKNIKTKTLIYCFLKTGTKSEQIV